MSLQRPPNLSLLDGPTPLPLTHKQVVEVAPNVSKEQELTFKLVCFLIANGESPEGTARKVGCTVEWVNKVKSAPVGMDMIIRMQQDSSPDVHARVKKMSSIALDVQTRLLLSQHTPPAILAKLSNDVIDRAEGKATQITETRNFNFDMKDAKKIDEAILATQEKLARIESQQKRLISVS